MYNSVSAHVCLVVSMHFFTSGKLALIDLHVHGRWFPVTAMLPFHASCISVIPRALMDSFFFNLMEPLVTGQRRVHEREQTSTLGSRVVPNGSSVD